MSDTFNAQVNELTRHIERIGNEIKPAAEKALQATNELSARLSEVEKEVVATRDYAPSSARGGVVRHKVQDALADSSSFDHIKGWNEGTARMNLTDLPLAALVNEGKGSGTGMPTSPERGGIIGQVLPQPRLLQFLRTREVHSDSVEFIKLETTDDVDYQEGEGDEKAELTFEGTRKKAHIATIAGWTTASRQVLGDNEALQQVIEDVMTAKLLNKLTQQVIAGNGSDSNGDWKISGLLIEGVIMAAPTMSSFADKIGEAIVRQQNLGFSPGVIAVNPLDWLTHIATAKTQTEQAYLFGSPTAPAPTALWNLPAVLEPSVPQGHALVIDPTYVTVLDRQQPTILISNSHKDYFTKNLVAILAELRAGLEVLDSGAVYIVEPAST